MRDVLEAEYTLFGEGNRHLTVRRSPGGADRLNDLAQAWLDGRHDEVLAYARAHAEKVRLRGDAVNIGCSDRDRDLVRRVVELREKRWTTEKIAKHLQVSKSKVQAICRGLTHLPRRFPSRQKLAPQEAAAKVLSLRGQPTKPHGWAQDMRLFSGLSIAEMAKELGVSERTVCRWLKRAKQSLASATT